MSFYCCCVHQILHDGNNINVTGCTLMPYKHIVEHEIRCKSVISLDARVKNKVALKYKVINHSSEAVPGHALLAMGKHNLTMSRKKKLCSKELWCGQKAVFSSISPVHRRAVVEVMHSLVPTSTLFVGDRCLGSSGWPSPALVLQFWFQQGLKKGAVHACLAATALEYEFSAAKFSTVIWLTAGIFGVMSLLTMLCSSLSEQTSYGVVFRCSIGLLVGFFLDISLELTCGYSLQRFHGLDKMNGSVANYRAQPFLFQVCGNLVADPINSASCTHNCGDDHSNIFSWFSNLIGYAEQDIIVKFLLHIIVRFYASIVGQLGVQVLVLLSSSVSLGCHSLFFLTAVCFVPSRSVFIYLVEL